MSMPSPFIILRQTGVIIPLFVSPFLPPENGEKWTKGNTQRNVNVARNGNLAAAVVSSSSYKSRFGIKQFFKTRCHSSVRHSVTRFGEFSSLWRNF